MELPKIDLSVLPDLHTLTGIFVSGHISLAGTYDRIVILMTYLYTISPHTGLI